MEDGMEDFGMVWNGRFQVWNGIGTRKAEVLNSLIMNITAKANNKNDILQTFR